MLVRDCRKGKALFVVDIRENIHGGVYAHGEWMWIENSEGVMGLRNLQHRIANVNLIGIY